MSQKEGVNSVTSPVAFTATKRSGFVLICCSRWLPDSLVMKMLAMEGYLRCQECSRTST